MKDFKNILLVRKGKTLFLILNFSFLILNFSFAQQHPLYSQYMFNRMAVNPAYAGSKDALSATLLLRNQWVGLDGAPTTQTLTVHSPYKANKISS